MNKRVIIFEDNIIMSFNDGIYTKNLDSDVIKRADIENCDMNFIIAGNLLYAISSFSRPDRDNLLYYSYNGIEWFYLQFDEKINGVVYNNIINEYYAIGENNIYESKDGIHWKNIMRNKCYIGYGIFKDNVILYGPSGLIYKNNESSNWIGLINDPCVIKITDNFIAIDKFEESILYYTYDLSTVIKIDLKEKMAVSAKIIYMVYYKYDDGSYRLILSLNNNSQISTTNLEDWNYSGLYKYVSDVVLYKGVAYLASSEGLLRADIHGRLFRMDLENNKICSRINVVNDILYCHIIDTSKEIIYYLNNLGKLISTELSNGEIISYNNRTLIIGDTINDINLSK